MRRIGENYYFTTLLGRDGKFRLDRRIEARWCECFKNQDVSKPRKIPPAQSENAAKILCQHPVEYGHDRLAGARGILPVLGVSEHVSMNFQKNT